MGAVRVLGHVKACAEPGRYAGWPANHGIWRWGDEILAGFQIGHYKEQAGHTIDWTQPIRKVFARSRDGGETWTLEDTLPDALDNLVDRPGAPDTPHHRAVPCPGGIDFSHPDFVMTFSHADFHVGLSRFWVSYDRCARLSWDEGQTWGEEIVLRDDGATGDLGYTRTVQRDDGSVVTVYYFNEAATGPECYIGATLWRVEG